MIVVGTLPMAILLSLLIGYPSEFLEDRRRRHGILSAD